MKHITNTCVRQTLTEYSTSTQLYTIEVKATQTAICISFPPPICLPADRSMYENWWCLWWAPNIRDIYTNLFAILTDFRRFLFTLGRNHLIDLFVSFVCAAVMPILRKTSCCGICSTSNHQKITFFFSSHPFIVISAQHRIINEFLPFFTLTADCWSEK